MRTSVQMKVNVHYPETDAGRQELMQRVAEVHADFVHTKIQKLNCTAEQKRKLTDAVIETVSKDI